MNQFLRVFLPTRRIGDSKCLTFLHSESPKLETILAFLSAVGLRRIGTLSGEATLSFLFLPSSSMDGSSRGEQLLSLKVGAILEELSHPGKQTGSHEDCSPLLKCGKRLSTPISLIDSRKSVQRKSIRAVSYMDTHSLHFVFNSVFSVGLVKLIRNSKHALKSWQTGCSQPYYMPLT